MSADVVVLGYHAVSDDWPWRYAVTPDALSAHLGELERQGYRLTTFSAALAATEGRVAAVTFDDSLASVASRAAPILAAHGAPATVFAVTDHVGSDRPMTWHGIEEWLGTLWENELLPLGWDDLEALRNAGWEVGSHTRTHPALPDLDDDRLADELGGSRAAVRERLGDCDVLAYPYGAHDARVVAAAAAAGYAAAATFPPHFARGDALAIPRVGVYRDTAGARFRVLVSPTVRRVRSTRVWPLARAAVRRLRR